MGCSLCEVDLGELDGGLAESSGVISQGLAWLDDACLDDLD